MSTPFEHAAARVAAGESTAADEARSLVSRMTLDEKLECLDGDVDCWPGMAGLMRGSYHQRTFPAAVVARLGIPGLHFSDGPRGCVIGRKTAFPVSMARGAAWDVDLEHRIGAAIGAELRAVDATYYGGVCVNLLRHPGWGRAQETYGEEPFHVGEMGRALMLGAQQHVMACVKHFAANSMENARFKVDVHADERALHEVYLPHFRRIVESGVASVMSAYNSLNGTFCGENHELLTGVLRDEWGFDGFVISDFIHGLRDAVRSVEAGLDVEMPFRQARRWRLPEAIERGRLTEGTIDVSVERTVATLLRFHPITSTPAPQDVVLSTEHRALAREAATKSIVVLRNEAGALPLEPMSLRRIAVLGRLARVRNLGDRGSSDVLVPDCATPLDGLRAALEGVQVDHDDHDTSIVEGADAVIVVVGTTHRDEGEYIDPAATDHLTAAIFPPITEDEQVDLDLAAPSDPMARGVGGDRRRLTLSVDDEALVLAAAARHPRTVVVVMGGSAVVMEPWRREVAAIVMLWYPGIEGGHALADVLLGAVNPSGRLPFAIPTDQAHLAHWDPDADHETYDLWHGHWLLARDGHEPAFPFGFGLSYTSFEVQALAVRLAEPDAYGFGGATATVTVANTGHRDGATVVQVYGGLPESTVERPPRRLIGFRRVEVAAEATLTVDVELDLRQLDVRQHRSWWVEGGDYRITAALHSLDPHAVEVDVHRTAHHRAVHHQSGHHQSGHHQPGHRRTLH